MRLAVIGFPVAHSRSPAMQNAALATLGLGDEWTYGAVEVPPEGFEAKVREMAAGDYAGANVTVPHKEAALALADEPSEAAREIGAANTLVFSEGRIEAHNTDAGGLLAALPGSPRGRRALVLGAGGAARAAVWALAGAGATVDVWNRTSSRAEALVAALAPDGHPAGPAADGGRVGPEATQSPGATLAVVDSPDQGSYDLIVNTTAVGLHGEDPFAELPLVAEGFTSDQTVVDMVYRDGPGPLLEAAAAARATVVDGIEVLVQQGALSLEIWTGRKPPLDVMRAAARA